jgi:anti-anti-sigma regulatory factor
MSQIILAPVLDLPAAFDLKRELLDAFAGGEAPVIDASQVQRVTTPGLQILVAAVARGASIRSAPPALTDAAQVLDLMKVLNLEGPHV